MGLRKRQCGHWVFTVVPFIDALTSLVHSALSLPRNSAEQVKFFVAPVLVNSCGFVVVTEGARESEVIGIVRLSVANQLS